MHDLTKLIVINLSGKVVTIVLFSLLARTVESSHLAYIALIPALAPMLLSLFGFGVNTLLEREVPQLLSKDSDEGFRLMRSGYLLNLLSILIVLGMGFLFVDHWAALVLNKYDYEIDTITWILLPIATYMLLKITGLFLLLEGKSAKFGLLRVYSDIVAKVAILIIYLVQPSEMAVFIGFAVGQLPFLVYGIWLQRSWLFKIGLIPLNILLRNAVPFYMEGIFNAARNQGDSLLVSSVLGPVSMAGYYVAKTVANQLSVFFNPVNSYMVHHLAFQKGKSQVALEEAFKQVWHLSVPICVWLACAVSAVSPYLIKVVAGEQYTFVWPVAFLLCMVTSCLALYSLSSRVLLIIGSAYERFRITIIQTILILFFTCIFVPLFETKGVALSWLLAILVSLYAIKFRTSQLGFYWPKLRSFVKPMILTLLMPILCLYLFSQGINNLIILTIFLLMVSCSLWAILFYQDEYEKSRMLIILPDRFIPIYRKFFIN